MDHLTVQPAIVRYLLTVANQPDDQWEGFYHPAYSGSNLEYLFQIAFTGYALVAIQRQVPAWCGPTSPIGTALLALSRRMRAALTTHYWTARRPDPDPIRQANIMYSGHLSCLLSLTELYGAAAEADTPFTITRTDGLPIATYDHARVARAIHTQMVRSASHGVACEPGVIYVCCNDHAALSNILYDHCHPGEDLSAINAAWVAWVRQRMVLARWHRALPGPPGGVLSAAHQEQTNRSLPFASNFTDAWGLALLTPFAPDLAAELAPRLWRRRVRTRAGSYLPSLSLLTRMEASDAGLNTGFAYVLARELGADMIATELRAWAWQHLRPRAERDHAWLDGQHSALYTTALFALGDALAPGDLGRIFKDPPRTLSTAPRVALLDPPEAILDMAHWDARTQQLRLRLAPDAPTARVCITGCSTLPVSVGAAQSQIVYQADVSQASLDLHPGIMTMLNI